MKNIYWIFGLLLFMASCSSKKQGSANVEGSLGNEVAGFQLRQFASETTVVPKAQVSRDAVIINPRKFDSWKATGILSGNNSTSTYLIEPGDYRSWGELKMSRGGTAAAPLTLSYYDAKAQDPYLERTNPARLPKNRQVLIENVYVTGGHSHPKGHPDRSIVETEHIRFNGLSFSGNAETLDPHVRPNSPDRGKKGGASNVLNFTNDVQLNNCLVENVRELNAIRIRGNRNVISNCVIRNCFRIPGSDNIAIVIYPNKNYWAANNRVENCELYNCTDCVQIHSVKDPQYLGLAPGTVIHNNDCYLTEEYYVQRDGQTLAAAEDGFDLKTGGTAAEPVLITNNLIRGMRQTDTGSGGSGGLGVALNLHLFANHIRIENNLIHDNRIGILNGTVDAALAQSRRANIRVVNNLFNDFYSAGGRDASGGTVISGSLGMEVNNNTVMDARELINAGYRANYNLYNNVLAGLQLAGKWSGNHTGTSRSNVWVQPPSERFGGEDAPGDRVVERLNNRKLRFIIQPLTAPQPLEISVPDVR
ncbi:hypothetical protein CEQ90_06635 [Lewinellaceae bacterium SD302]|nr:hypothetical protein CEQ90_06635 [Lewinellaceae bacterium SD302]